VQEPVELLSFRSACFPFDTGIDIFRILTKVALRQTLDLYVCLRPVRWFRGVVSPVKEPDDMSTAASTIACMAGVISAPTPSPVIKGIVGTSGTDNTPFCCLVILLIYLSFYILLQSCSEVKVRWFRTNTPYLLN